MINDNLSTNIVILKRVNERNLTKFEEDFKYRKKFKL